MAPTPDRRTVDHAIEESYRSLIESVQDYAIFMLDKKGCITSWDQGARRQLGYTRNEIFGKHYSVLFVPADIKKGAPKTDMQDALKRGRHLDEREYRRKNGTRFWSTGVLTSTV